MFKCSSKPDVMFMKSGHDVCILELHFYRNLISSTLLHCYYNRKKTPTCVHIYIYIHIRIWFIKICVSHLFLTLSHFCFLFSFFFSPL